MQRSQPKARPPPPIMISGVSEYHKLHSTIKAMAKTEFSIKLTNNGIFKINTKDANDYRMITQKLNQEAMSWYTYEDKQTRPIRVMLKNLHSSCNTDSIVSDLKEQGFKIISAVNKLKWRTKEPLDMFLLSFEADEDIEKIYKIKKILNSIVSIEALKSSNIIPQCKNCQAFGHTKNYCSKQPRCVKT